MIAIRLHRNLKMYIVENISALFKTIRIKRTYRIENPKEEGKRGKIWAGNQDVGLKNHTSKKGHCVIC